MISTLYGQAIDRAQRHAPFLAQLIAREPDLVERLRAGELPTVEWDAALTVARRLRRARRQEALVVAIGDLSGALNLAQVTQRLSDFADRALDCAIVTSIGELVPGAEPVGYAAFELGQQVG